jgi:hypothetical protein
VRLRRRLEAEYKRGFDDGWDLREATPPQGRGRRYTQMAYYAGVHVGQMFADPDAPPSPSTGEQT